MKLWSTINMGQMRMSKEPTEQICKKLCFSYIWKNNCWQIWLKASWECYKSWIKCFKIAPKTIIQKALETTSNLVGSMDIYKITRTGSNKRQNTWRTWQNLCNTSKTFILLEKHQQL